MSQLSCSNHSWACFYLKAKASLQGKAQPAMREGKVMCIILHLPQAQECTCSKSLQLSWHTVTVPWQQVGNVHFNLFIGMMDNWKHHPN